MNLLAFIEHHAPDPVTARITHLALADERFATAEAAGAANVLRIGDEGRILADNTDGLGLLGALQAGGWRPEDGVVVLPARGSDASA